MRRYVLSICVFLTSLIFLFALCVLSCSAKMTKYLLNKQESIIISRGAEGLNDSKRIIEADLEKKVQDAAEEAFNILTETLYDNDVNITEEEAAQLYEKIIMNVLRAKYGESTPGLNAGGEWIIGTDEAGEADVTNGDIADGADGDVSDIENAYGTGSDDVSGGDTRPVLTRSLEAMLPELDYGNLTVSFECDPTLVLEEGNVSIKNVVVNFNYGTLATRDNRFEVSAPVTDMTFYDENPDIFPYAMVAGQGIYITGRTSTILGNVYAGGHGSALMRKAEALYGESGKFGGLNIMSTQLAIYGDEVIADGNINMKGAFVVFGSEEQPVTIHADDIMQTDVVASKNIYAHFGELTGDGILQKKLKVAEAIAKFPEIDHYYDTDNDRTYTGTYRKIISGTDITVTNDVTGVIMTPGNVIVEEGVNIEGLIICGDRIYVQGNNNIVSSVDVMRKILSEELYEDTYMQIEDMTVEEQALSAVRLYMSDYMGGIVRRGLYR